MEKKSAEKGRLGKFIMIVGPSGSGKDELVKVLLKKIPNSARFVTTTNRKPRPEEKPTDYFFISTEEFKKGIANGDFFEFVNIYGNLYGSSMKVLDKFRQDFDYVFGVIDVDGAQLLKSKIPDALVIFLHPGSLEEMEQRLRRVRGARVSKESLAKRLERISYELSFAPTFDVVIHNREGRFNETVEKALKLILN